MSTSKSYPLVACQCGWIGRVSELVNADGCHHCPKCGEFFMPIDPNPSLPSA